STDPEKYFGLAQRLAEMIGTGSDAAEIRRRLRRGISEKSTNNELEISILQGLVSGLLRNKNAGEIITSEFGNLEKGLFEHPSTAVRSAILSMLGQKNLAGIDPETIQLMMNRAWEKASSSDEDTEYRIQMMEVLKLGDAVGYETELKRLLIPSEEPGVQI